MYTHLFIMKTGYPKDIIMEFLEDFKTSSDLINLYSLVGCPTDLIRYIWSVPVSKIDRFYIIFIEVILTAFFIDAWDFLKMLTDS